MHSVRLRCLFKSASSELGHVVSSTLTFDTCNPATECLIDDTLPLGSTDVRFSEGWYHSPDQQFKIRSFHFPGIVYEVAYA